MQLKPINALALKLVDMRAEKYKDSIYHTIWFAVHFHSPEMHSKSRVYCFRVLTIYFNDRYNIVMAKHDISNNQITNLACIYIYWYDPWRSMIQRDRWAAQHQISYQTQKNWRNLINMLNSIPQRLVSVDFRIMILIFEWIKLLLNKLNKLDLKQS